jgi:hypothetical protein
LVQSINNWKIVKINIWKKMPDLVLKIGGISLKNPLICGSGEHFIDLSGIEKVFKSGAAAAVIKSTNDSDAAKEQLGKTDFHVGVEVFRLTAGGMLVVPPNVMHHAEVVGDEDVLNLDIFTPTRPEFIE